MKARIKPTGVKDAEVSRALDDIRSAIPDLEVFRGARLIEGVALADGVQKRIAHGLGRKYRGRIVVSQSAAAHIVDDVTKHDTSTYIYLTASGGSPTVRIVVF